jgi:Fur family peroxide stress response transcriptional regulator
MSVDHAAADTMLTELKRSGLKLTGQRRAIVQLLAGDRTHPTAQELYERLRPTHPTMSFATVYNTLDALARCGLTGALRLGSAVRYDPNTAPHHHAVCDACGAIVDLPAAPAPSDAAAHIYESSGFSVRTEERTYRGICSRCI